MLDLGWQEFIVIALVLVLIVGPKDLPEMLRTFGKTTKKLRGMAGDFRKQFDEALKEAELDRNPIDMTLARGKALPWRSLISVRSLGAFCMRRAIGPSPLPFSPWQTAQFSMKSARPSCGPGISVSSTQPASPAVITNAMSGARMSFSPSFSGCDASALPRMQALRQTCRFSR